MATRIAAQPPVVGHSRRWPVVQPVLGALARTVCWFALVLAALFTTIALGWVVLAIILLGSGPYTSGPGIAAPPVLPILAGLVAATAGVALLTARVAASWHRVGQAIGLVVALVAIVGTTWALAAPNEALYFAREMAWDGSNVLDYTKAPQRAISASSSPYHFSPSSSSQVLQTVQYRQGGQWKQSSLTDFLVASQTTSLIVIKNGTIIDESYANGYARDSIVTSESVAKSFTSALVGIAISEGFIGGVNDKMVAYLPELRGKGLDDVTIRDLLTMSAGNRYIFETQQPPLINSLGLSDHSRTTNYPDLRQLMLDIQSGADPPGTAFSYNDAQPMLLGMILERATHRSVSQYLQEKLWQPLGMEYPASWSLDSAQSGFEKMAMGLNARAIDFAKFGQLYLDHGRWNGQQLIPAAWVSDSTAPDPTDQRPWRRALPWQQAGGYYKYLWWGLPQPDGSYAYVARGGYGPGQMQAIYVSPRDGVVIVRFALVDGSIDWLPDVFQSITDQLR
jgi:CubicO group peptidase (beta-lactamase class C family)